MLITKLKASLVAACVAIVATGGSVVVVQHALAATGPGEQGSGGTRADSPSESNSNFNPQWKKLTDEQADEISRRHLRALMYAVHLYADSHQSKLPPAEVPNPDLPPQKRLSGFVLLLPYLGLRPSYLPENDPEWQKWHTDNDAAKKLFGTIDLKKGWDDPVNAKAAKAVVPELVVPSGAPLRDRAGYAVSHFAFVRGYAGKDNGAFPLGNRKEITYGDITDGTSTTLAIGEIYQNLGPWIAAGPSTARFVVPSSAGNKIPSFGSQYKGCAYFANCDGSTYFFDMEQTHEKILRFLAERADWNVVHSDDYYRYPTFSDWKKSRGGR
jgi:hypothetical protein